MIIIYFDIFRLMIMTFVLCGSYQKVVIIARSARFKSWRGRTPVLGLCAPKCVSATIVIYGAILKFYYIQFTTSILHYQERGW